MRFIFVLITTLVAFGPVYAEISNAGLEQWIEGQPVDWTTIDSGIEVNRDDSQVNSGAYSARVTVNTGRQSVTDMRQSIAVLAGETYDIEVSVMHTEGGMRARLYVDGYRSYSDPLITFQWQTLSYSFTATSNTVIETGVRFYDTRDFDGSEDVFIDNFKPGEAAPLPPEVNTCTDVKVSLLTDRYGSETSWQLINAESEVVLEGSGYDNNTRYDEADCLDEGTYTFVIDDTYGDGICCRFGSGEYVIEADGVTIVSGGEFTNQASQTFVLESTTAIDELVLGEYYADAQDLTGYELKTALYEIIRDHESQGYSALWRFYADVELDFYYEEDGSILDIYSENPVGSESYTFSSITDQCGNFRVEGDCYNREHSFPRNWFGGSREPMNSDVHHVFLTDGFVNGKRGNYPYGEVGSPEFISENGSLLGSANLEINYNATVFEPIDEFKGDLARAQFYMATRYENLIGSWEANSDTANAALDGTNTNVFEDWYLTLLKRWHQQDPVSQKEIDRNNAAFLYQGNRNPYVDHPELVFMVWGGVSD